MWVAGGHTVYATAEWASLLPLSNGCHQIVKGLSVDTVTGPFGDIDMAPVMDEIKKVANNNKEVHTLKAPKNVSGDTDMLIGIGLNCVFPEPVFTTPEGLTLFKSKFLPGCEGEIACVGGPSKAFSAIANQAGVSQVISMFTRITANPKAFSTKLEYFPCNSKAEITAMRVAMLDGDISEEVMAELEESDDDELMEDSCDVDSYDKKLEYNFDEIGGDSVNNKLLVDQEIVDVETKAEDINNVKKSSTIINYVDCSICEQAVLAENSSRYLTIQSELKKYLDMHDTGLSMEYRCPSCRNCLDCKRGEHYERVSIQQEAEQCMVRDSIWIDPEKKRAVARLPFRVDPQVHLTNNRGLAIKMLDKVCEKYCKDEEVVELIEKAFDKLHTNGHIKFWDEISDVEKQILKTAPISYYIPWDVAFSGSISTPARPTFNASKNTPKGTNLNDVIVKGIPNLISLLQMVLGWVAGPEAMTGDISQFYNAVLLALEHLPYQRFVYKKKMDSSGKLLEGVICTLIYGVRSVSAQMEVLVSMIADRIRVEHPEVAEFLVKSRYVDDFGKSLVSKDQGRKIIEIVDQKLGEYQLKVKGWAMSGEDPPLEISKDGLTVMFAGMVWMPRLDYFMLNYHPLHFAQKRRGRLPKDLEVFDGKFGTLEDFVPKDLSRRKISSKLMSRYDLLGKEAPFTLKLKADLRTLIKVNPEWDAPVSDDIRSQWIKNFAMMEKMKDYKFCRAVVPIDAVDCKKMRVWVLNDAAKGGITVGAWAGYKRKNGSYSCSHLFGRGLLASEQLSIPKLELHSLNSAANIHVLLETALHEWLDVILVGGDSEISLSWVMYENNKLDVFTRNRANNIRSKIPLKNLHWVEGKYNLSDNGTRPSAVTEKTVNPESKWINGKDWMRLLYEEALETGIVRKVSDIKLDHESKKIFKEGLMFEEDYERQIKGFIVRITKTDPKKVIQCEAESRYIYPPLKYNFRRTVRTVACILRAVRKFKLGGARKMVREGTKSVVDMEKMLMPNLTKFKYFSVDQNNKKPYLKNFFWVEGFVITDDKNTKTSVNINEEDKMARLKRKYFALTEEDLSASLSYLFRIGTEEVLRYTEEKKVDEISVKKDGILYFKGRIIDEQTLRSIGDLEDIIDIETFTGFNFNVPVLYRYSPLSLSIASHIHYNILEHKGFETCYRLSLGYVHILQGRAVFREIGEDCVKCKILRKKYVDVEMGPLLETQISISPVFYCTLVDLFGPLTAYCPGYEKVTRKDAKVYKVWMMVMACVATGTVNVQLVEKEDTDGVMSGFNRFFCEATVPKIMYPDEGTQLVKAVREMEGVVLDLQYRLAEQRGIEFRTCLPQGHSAHGRVERVIRSLRESLSAANVKKERLTATGWQTVAKTIENLYNNLPLGCYYRRSQENVSILKILTPNLLRGKVSSRSPNGLFDVVSDTGKIMQKVNALFRAWYQVWNTIYLPQILKRQKWHKSSEEVIMEDDIVLFKKTESELSTEWVLGKVEQVRPSRDGLVRECIILYKSTGETDRMITVDRPARELVKLFNVEDSGLFEDIENARSISKHVLEEKFEEAALGALSLTVTQSNKVRIKNQFLPVKDDYLVQTNMINQPTGGDRGVMQGNTVLWGG